MIVESLCIHTYRRSLGVATRSVCIADMTRCDIFFDKLNALTKKKSKPQKAP